MKRLLALFAIMLSLAMALAPAALAAEPVSAADMAQVCYPTAVTRSEDGTEITSSMTWAPRRIPPASPAPISSRTASTIP